MMSANKNIYDRLCWPDFILEYIKIFQDFSKTKLHLNNLTLRSDRRFDTIVKKFEIVAKFFRIINDLHFNMNLKLISGLIITHIIKTFKVAHIEWQNGS